MYGAFSGQFQVFVHYRSQRTSITNASVDMLVSLHLVLNKDM